VAYYYLPNLAAELALEYMKRDNRFCRITQVAEGLRAWRERAHFDQVEEAL
jgi:hypothetical protein